jgi:hypothetical protein
MAANGGSAADVSGADDGFSPIADNIDEDDDLPF